MDLVCTLSNRSLHSHIRECVCESKGRQLWVEIVDVHDVVNNNSHTLNSDYET